MKIAYYRLLVYFFKIPETKLHLEVERCIGKMSINIQSFLQSKTETAGKIKFNQVMKHYY